MSADLYENGLFANQPPMHFNRYATILESDNTGFWAIAKLPVEITTKCELPVDTALILTLIDNMGSYSYLSSSVKELEKDGVMAIVDSSAIRVKASGVRVKRNDGLAVTVSGRFELQAEFFGEYTTVWTTGEATLESDKTFSSSGLLFSAILDAYITMNSDKAYTDNRAITMIRSSRKKVEFYEKPVPDKPRASFSIKNMLKF